MVDLRIPDPNSFEEGKRLAQLAFTDDGLLTDESSNTVVSTEQFINSVVLPEIAYIPFNSHHVLLRPLITVEEVHNRENAENLSMQEKQEIEYVLQKDRNAKSIMSSVAINAADDLELVISGPDEKQAAETINNLFCS